MLTHQSRRRWALCLFGGVALTIPTLCEATTPDQSLEIGAGVEIVTVDAVVLDGQDRPVKGLTARDFTIKVEGVAQEIVNFEAVDLEPEHEPATETPTQAPTETPHPAPPAAALEEEAASSRRVMIVFDDLHLTQRSAIQARRIVEELLDSGLLEGDQVRVTSTGSAAAWTAQVPEGMEDLKQFLSRLEGRRTTRHPMGMTDYEAMRIALLNDQAVLSEVFVRLCTQGLIGNMRRCDEDAATLDRGLPIDENHYSSPDATGGSAGRSALQAEARGIEGTARAARVATLLRLQRVLDAAGAERGRKVVFILSEGFLDDLERPEWRLVLDAARRANAVLYLVDPRGETALDATSGADVMQPVHMALAGDFYDRLPLDSRGGATLAYATGGSALTNAAGAAHEMAKVLDRSRAYYLLAFAPRRQKRDGKYRKLKVEVQRPDVKVIARQGYYAPKDDEPQESDANRQLLRALDSPVDSSAVPLHLAVYVLGPAADDRVALLVAAEVDGSAVVLPERGKRAHQHLDWALLATPRDGAQPMAARWPMDLDLSPDAAAFFGAHGLPAYRNIELPAGTYQLRVVVDEDGRVGSATQTLQVPERDAFRISTPILSDSAQPATADRPPQPIPVAHRAFPSGSTILCLYGVYGAKIDPATSAPRVRASFSVGPIGQDPVIDRAPTELQPAPDGSFAETVPLVLRGASPGQYAMSIRVEDLVGGAVAERRELFTVR